MEVIEEYRVNGTQAREDWLEERRGGIGGSEVSVLAGLDDYGRTPLDVYRSKVYRIDTPDNPTLKSGRMLEPVVGAHVEEALGRALINPNGIIWDKGEKIFFATPDRLLGSDTVVELKTTRLYIDECKLSWFLQAQWYMGVTQRDKAIIAWLIQGVDFDYINVQRNESIIADLRDVARIFWDNHVAPKLPPSPISSADAANLFPNHISGKSLEVDGELYDAVAELNSTKDAIAELKEKKDQLETKIKIAMKDSELLTYNGRKITTWRKAKDGEVFDKEGFKADHPDLWKKYQIKKTGSRRLLVKL